jgi:hypothetical protein
MSSYFQSSLIYGVSLSQEHIESIHNTKFIREHLQNIKDKKTNFLTVGDAGAEYEDSGMVIGLLISDAYLDNCIQKLSIDEIQQIIIDNKPRIILELKSLYKELNIPEIPKLDLFLTAYLY